MLSIKTWRCSYLILVLLSVILLAFPVRTSHSFFHQLHKGGRGLAARGGFAWNKRSWDHNGEDNLHGAASSETYRPPEALEPAPSQPPLPLPIFKRENRKAKSLLRNLRLPIFINVAWSTALAFFFKKGKFSYVLDGTAHGYLAGPLGFLLAFRCSEGYNRCVVAREVWDGVLNQCRDMVRAILSIDDLLGPKYTRRLIDLVCAYALALESQVMTRPRRKQLGRLLSDEEIEILHENGNAPLMVAELLSQTLVDATEDNEKVSSSPRYSNLVSLVDGLGHSVTKCQRLMKPAVPRIYAQHGLNVLSAWVFTLPLTLLEKFSLPILPVVMAVITWAFCGLIELGAMLQYPFHLGIVDLRSLWELVICDARDCFEGARSAREDD